MKILLDTHALLWALADPGRLGTKARSAIESPHSLVYVSAVSAWEIAIKHALARADMPVSAAEACSWAEASGFDLLPLALEHILTLEQLPLHHRDPFDRLLVAQAISEPLTLLSADAALVAYGAMLHDARR